MPTLVGHVMRPPSVLPECSQPRRQRRVAGRHDAAIAQGTEVFRRIQAERADRAQRPQFAAAQGRAMRLAAILDHRDAVTRADRQDRVQVGGLTVEMHGDDRTDRRRPGGGVASTFASSAGSIV